MNILITQHRLIHRGGTEFYVLDLASKLLQLGHRVVVYCPHIGKFAKRFGDATIPVVDDLGKLWIVPDIIHGQHGLETLTAMIRFPETPAIYVLHDWAWEIDTPPILDRVMKYVAVDATCLDRLLIRENAPFERCMVIQNGVDLRRFKKKETAAQAPRRALVFSNYMQSEKMEEIAAACQSLDIELDSMGELLNTASDTPETILGQYDLVFARGRCAREALAAGCSVVVAGNEKVGELVTAANIKWFCQLNFGRRLLIHDHSKQWFLEQIERYDANDSAKASEFVRNHYSLDKTTSELLSVYQQAISDFKSGLMNRVDEHARLREASTMASFIGKHSRQRNNEIEVVRPTGTRKAAMGVFQNRRAA